METFHSPQGELTLVRWPQRKNDVLRAWDAADEYLLNYLAEQNLPIKNSKILVVNDAFGALSCALSNFHLSNWSDSKISHLATAENSRINAIENQPSEGAFSSLKSTESPAQSYDLVLIKIPKTMALLEDQLIKLKPHLTDNTKVVAAGMVKHLPKSAFQLFEKYTGSLTTSLAKKKARLLFVNVDVSLPVADNPYPTTYSDAELGLTLSNHANLFSRDHLDLGARFFLEQFTTLPAAKNVVDLACGNGVLGIRYQQLHPDSTVEFTDESYMAIASSRENYAAMIANENAHTIPHKPPQKPIDSNFKAEDGLQQNADNSVDLILCNPPFHQQHVIGEQIAMALFQQSKRCLKVGGELWIVANRHLTYQTKLDRLFGNCRVVDTNKKFVVLRVVKR